MKIKTFIQHSGVELALEDLEKKIKKAWKDGGNLQKDMESVSIYLKPEENKCYYVINDSVSASIELI